MPTIALSRFQKFIANSVVAAINAKVLLNQASIPLGTEHFTLTLSGTLVDDMGGLGINEIERISVNVTPETVTTSRVDEPKEVSTVETDPETTETLQNATDSDLSDNVSEMAATDNSSQSSTDAGTESATDEQSAENTQNFGRAVRTTTVNETEP